MTMTRNRQDLSVRRRSTAGRSFARSLARSFCVASAALLAGSMVVGCSDDEKPKPQLPRHANLGPKKVPPFMEGTVFQLVEVAGTEPQPVSGFGFVTHLAGTGDSTV